LKFFRRPQKPKQDRKRMEKEIASLGTKIDKARHNIALCEDDDNIRAIEQDIRQWKQEKERQEAELRQAKPPKEEDLNKHAMAVLSGLYDLAAMCKSLSKPSAIDSHGERYIINGDGTKSYSSIIMLAPKRVKRLFQRHGQIVVKTRKVGRGTGTRHEL